MAETKKRKKKKKNLLNDLDFLQYIRLFFLIFLACLLVYLYYLHTKGILISTIAEFWKKNQKTLSVGAGVTVYSAVVFYLGYRKGKKG